MVSHIVKALVAWSLLQLLDTRVLYIAERYGRERGRHRDIDRAFYQEENAMELDNLELFKRLMSQLSEGGKYSDPKEAQAWVEAYNHNLTIMNNEVSIASWNYSTNINEHTAQVRDNVTLKWLPWAQKASKEATKFYRYKVAFDDPELVRTLKIITRCGPRPSPDDVRMTEIQTELETIYSSASVTDGNEVYKLEPELTEILQDSRDYERLKWVWSQWRDQSGKLMKELYEENVELQNAAACDAGFYNNAGEQWRACNYEEPEEKTEDNEDLFIETMVEDLFEQIRPLYEELHAYVRFKLREAYPEQTNTSWFAAPNSPIPAHLLGNMWGQQWEILDLVKPFPDIADIDVTQKMKDNDWTVRQMFETAESFFMSIGLEPMTDTFWEKSMMRRPSDGREVVCHASAEDFSVGDDYRIKMCTTISQEDLETVHHEMGHIEYFMLYRPQPQVFREGANAAFHEAIGDTISLSVMTPRHLQEIELLDQEDISTEKWNGEYLMSDINFLMRQALHKIAFLPFGYLIDKWRWDVFSGDVTIDHYNKRWWEYRLRYQGMAPPVTRSEEDFDPGAKYHVAANVPYIRYFLSFIGQFQFHKALCEASNSAGFTEPLHTCDIYQSTAAGDLLRRTLELGSSVKWPVAMEKMTGGRKFDASAIRNYFRPLTEYLRSQRDRLGYAIGWEDADIDEFFES